MAGQWDRIGAVAIGRNEGERLRQCLMSLRRETDRVVYVDSGSIDGSKDLANSLGVEVVDLDLSIPFTAARARNAGFDALRERWPTTEYVQFVDGDTELLDGWLATAVAVLDERSDVVAVCGWRQERCSHRSIYNRICSIEWRSGVVGPIANFGGDVMLRASALAAVGGYDSDVIAAEDDELGVRLRGAGGVLLRVDRKSTLHDADMHHWHQWWARAKRCGYGFAQVSSLPAARGERKFARELRRMWALGAFLPIAALALTQSTQGLSLLAFGLYPLNAARIALATRRRGFSRADSVAWGASCALSPIPQTVGALQFHCDRLRGKRPKIIEYSRSSPPQ